jgi:tellurite resistance protein TerC
MQTFHRMFLWLIRKARRVVIFVIGTTILLIGIAMIVLPGPATLVIPIGLAILATEFVWAKKWLDYAKRQIDNVVNNTGKKSRDQGGSTVP